jgi:hypothetical protein
MTQLTALATETIPSLSLSLSLYPTDPAVFLTDLFWYLSNTVQPITRTGMDRMMDALFAPIGATTPFAPLLDDPEQYQRILANNVRHMSDLFKAHWTHIIIPAWNQHAEIRRVCIQSR